MAPPVPQTFSAPITPPAVVFVRQPVSRGDGDAVAVVTDSTAYLPDEVVEKYGITVVPLHVIRGQESSLEGIELTPPDFAKWITAPGRTASTRPPSASAFKAAYLATGAKEIVSIHLSGRISGTREAALQAARELADEGRAKVKVIDSRMTGMGLGFAVIAAAEQAVGGAEIWDVAAAAEMSARRTRIMLYVDTLEYLKRGGRIGAAAAWLGTALDLKPLLHMVDGAIEPLERVRGRDKAVQRLEELVVNEAGRTEVDIAMHHLAAEDECQALADRLVRRVPGLRSLHTSEVGAVIGAHVGPGLLGVAIHRR